MPLLITLRRLPGRLVLALEGELDLVSAPALRERLDTVLAEHPEPDLDLDLDLTGVGFLDCAGARVIAEALDRLEERGGRLTVLRPKPIALHLLQLIGLAPELRIVGATPYRDRTVRPDGGPRG
ncbi:STAS domain-containing protein [Nonomuraea sp. NPDC050310]|uniref:STAS domain-containing protein n=1 Tax=unclassified Nonomuraea TaxID=2593643 RepID=UPI0033ED53A6